MQNIYAHVQLHSTYPMPKAGPVTIVLRSIYSNGAVNYMFFRACILKNNFLGSMPLAWNLLHAIYFVWYMDTLHQMTSLYWLSSKLEWL